MKEIVKKEWSELPSIWNGLINKNPVATPFQSYEFLTFTGKGKLHRKDIFRTLKLKELNLVLYSNNVPIAIAPLLYRTTKGKSTVYFRGHFTAALQLDLIYSSLRYDDFKFLMDGIREILGNVSFFLDWVYCKSPTSDYLIQYLSTAEIQEHECYSIPVPKKYDDWYQSLRKSRREKLRQIRNRMVKDDVQYTASFFIGEKIDSATYKEMMSVYADRFLIKNNFRFGPFHNVVKKVLQLILLKDKMTQFLNNTNQSFHAIVYMNHEVTAFTSGVLCKEKRIFLNRLAIYTKYGRYSPGAVLISSIIDYLAQQNEAGRTNAEKLDMSRGDNDNMSYKTVYGEEFYYNYTFIA